MNAQECIVAATPLISTFWVGFFCGLFACIIVVVCIMVAAAALTNDRFVETDHALEWRQGKRHGP